MTRARIFALIFLLFGLTGVSAGAVPKAALIEIDGAIGPATSQYFEQASDKALEIDAQLIILRLDTPGGLDTAMREIIKRILASGIPVVTYVAPSGSRAASAGTYILYASHVAAMAPGTNLGAATPIAVFGGESGKPDEKAPDDSAKSKAPTDKPNLPIRPGGAMEHKAVNDAVAYIRSLAGMRHRNADWAEKAVRDAASMPSEQALREHVIDVLADDTTSLLKQIDGRKVALASGEVTLHTAGMQVERIEPSWRLKVLSVLANPAVAYILMLIGIYGLLLEGYHPGAILPGVVGGICLLLALYAFQILPVNYAGLGLIGLGIALIVAETFIPSFGVLGIGGVIAVVVGSIMMFDTDVPGYEVPVALIGAIGAVSAGAVLLVLGVLMRTRRRATVIGQETMTGSTAEALEDFETEGWVSVNGERWRARTSVPVHKGQRLKVTHADGLLLQVSEAR